MVRVALHLVQVAQQYLLNTSIRYSRVYFVFGYGPQLFVRLPRDCNVLRLPFLGCDIIQSR